MGNILVVENNTNYTHYNYLKKHHTINTTHNIQESITNTTKECPDIIIIDVNPLEKILDIYLTIKKERKTRNIPLIIIYEEKTQTPPHKINETFIKKPVTEQTLLETIENLINKSHSPQPELRILYVANPLDKEEDRLQDNHSFKVKRIISPANTLKQVEDTKYDCILVDYTLLNTDGITFYKNIRGHTDIPVILYTSEGSENLAEKAFKAGIDDYIRQGKGKEHEMPV